jgi:hypothetical protein
MPSNMTDFGSFIPTTGVWDNSKQSMLAVRQNINAIALVLNNKVSGNHALTEFVNSKTWYPDPALSSTTDKRPSLRQGFGKVIIIGALPNTAVKTVAHGLDFVAGTTWMFTKIEGVGTKPGNAVGPVQPAAVSFPSRLIDVSVDQTNVIIETFADYSAYTRTIVYLEFIKE